MIRRFFSERPIRLPHLRPYVPRPSDPSIFWFNSERDDIVGEVARRVAKAGCSDTSAMEISLNDTAFHEIRRLAAQRDAEAKDSLGYWKSLIRRIAKLDDIEKRRVVEQIVTRMAKDVAGNFDPRVYHFANRVAPKLITGVMRPSSLPKDLMNKSNNALDELLSVEGDVERLRALQKRGTLVYVPTHSSNLDSIVLAQAIENSGLPPVIYGAGKNLFTNPIISFFMHNLGAYRVDRRIRAALYKDVLKTYSQIMIERGYHSLFFPGGTRSRSGMIESNVKLGLLGSAVSAYTQNQVRRVDQPVFFVPTTINYALVLEAETLIRDWLSEEGKARFIIEDDEFSRVDRWVSFFRKVVGIQAACVIRFGDPIDPFGNPVDDEGHSIDPNGQTISPASYIQSGGQPKLDHKRDAAYTRELGEVLAGRYLQDTVLMDTQVVAHVLFRHLTMKTPNADLYSRIRFRSEIALERTSLRRQVGEARDRLKDLSADGRVRISSVLRNSEPDELIDRSLAVWNGYHTSTAAQAGSNQVTICDPALLLYYQNRLVPFAEEIADDEYRLAARSIGRIPVRK